jgi:LuxR family glucitol operon transcriptional activator
MEITRKDIGYTVYSRLEEAMRFWLRDKLLNLFGDEWRSHIPKGLWDKASDKLLFASVSDVEDPMSVLDETEIPELVQIVCYDKGRNYANFIPEAMKQVEFQDNMMKLYSIRTKIAHVKLSFSAVDLDLLIDIADRMIPILGSFSNELQAALACIRSNPEKVVIRIPQGFLVYDEEPLFAHINNLPSADYVTDGGFIGRKEDMAKIESLLSSNLYRVVTITGAGGVGKTALAHKYCQNLLSMRTLPYDAIVWVSAKEEKLSATGIEPIEPTFRSYEEFLDSMLETFGWYDDIHKPMKDKEESVEVILRGGDKGILLVVDNLETIRDERVVEFIKTFPPPNKLLITSRLGLGEVERRYNLKEMDTKDAIILLRVVAREKGAQGLAKLPDEILTNYVEKMYRYPLAIKWVVGQVAVGRDLEGAVCDLTSSGGDVARFCFEYIFDTLLDDKAKDVLYGLAAYEKPLGRGVISHITELDPEQLDRVLRDLTIASLVVPSQTRTQEGIIETKYEVLPLTTNYIQSKLASFPEIHRRITRRTELVRSLIEEADRAGRQYRYSLRDMGAETEEEKVAATWAITAHQKYQSGDYNGAVDSFRRASEIAPNFPAIYRNWAIMESDAGFHERADELMRKATSLDKEDSRLWFVWGNIEKRRGRYDRANTYLRRALELSPEDSHIMSALAEVEKRRNNFDEADKLLRNSLKSATVSPWQKRRHEIICYTSLADNLRRWVEWLRRARFGNAEVSAKLSEAYEFASKAVELDENDTAAQDTLREVSLELAYHLKHTKGFESARPYYERAIVRNPQRAKEKKTTVPACYAVATSLIELGKLDEAKQYHFLGWRSLLEGDNYYERYKALATEFESQKTEGKLYSVVKGKGYGFLELHDQPGQSVFLHRSNVLPRVSIVDFDRMEGRTFSFILEPGAKLPEARMARLIREST